MGAVAEVVEEQAQPAVTRWLRGGIRPAMALGFGLLLGCSEPSHDPDAEIRALIEQAEQAAEARNADDLLELLAEDYRDSSGLGLKDVERRLRLLFLRNQDVHIFTRIVDIDLSDDAPEASVGLLVAMA